MKGSDMTTRRTALARALTPLLLAGLALGACSDDGDDEAAPTTTADGEATSDTEGDEAFCEQYLEVEATIAQGPDQEGEQEAAMEAFSSELEPKLEALEEDAPAEIEEPIAALMGIVRSVLDGERSSDFFLEEDYRAADSAVDGWLVDSCGYEVNEVTGVEYDFEGAPEEVAAGPVGFTFANEGEEVHEMVVFRIEDESAELQDLLLQENPEGVEFAFGAFATQGQSDTVFRELRAGRYAMVCFLPVGSAEAPTGPPQGNEAPPHFTQGMVAEFTVTE